MSLQKFYEKMIRLSLSQSYDKASFPIDVLCNQIDIETASIEEICIRSELIGFHIERKANFKKFGEEYLIQCLYFLNQMQNYEMLEEMFKCISNYKILQSIITSEFKHHCIDLYLENVISDHDISNILSLYIVDNCEDVDNYKHFKCVAKSTGIYHSKIPFEKINN
jgi:hypothetical protein